MKDLPRFVLTVALIVEIAQLEIHRQTSTWIAVGALAISLVVVVWRGSSR